LLQTQLRNKEINLKTYHERRKALSAGFDIQDLQSQIRVDEEKLRIATLSAEERFRLEKDLLNKRKQLFDAEAQNLEVP
jgi:hypothetical protein